MFLLLISFLFNALSASQGGHANVELVDMTYTFDETLPSWPGLTRFRMNAPTGERFRLQYEDYCSAVHAGTHMDAPCQHVFGRWCVDEIPLERLKAPAAVIDIIDKAAADPDALVEIDDLRRWERITGKSLDGTVVIIKSGWGRKWRDEEAFLGNADNDVENLHFPGLSPEAAQWLVDNRNIYAVGTEATSFDNGPSRDFRSHRILFEKNIFGLENVANVENIPIDGAILQMLPMKIGNATGAPVRIIASYLKRNQFPSYY